MKNLNLFVIFVITTFIVSCVSKNGSNSITNQVKVANPMDSLENQKITETKVTAELLWKFGRVNEI